MQIYLWVSIIPIYRIHNVILFFDLSLSSTECIDALVHCSSVLHEYSNAYNRTMLQYIPKRLNTTLNRWRASAWYTAEIWIFLSYRTSLHFVFNLCVSLEGLSPYLWLCSVVNGRGFILLINILPSIVELWSWVIAMWIKNCKPNILKEYLIY